MTENLSEQDMLREISPFGGYAHGDYVAQCQHCRRKFFGDKRAWQCLPCAVQQVLATMKDRGAAAERERAEDAAARERSMMDPEETASQIVMPLIKLLGERNRGTRDMAVMEQDTKALNRAANAIADALRDARDAGKAEGAAEERDACAQIADGYSNTKPVHGAQAPIVATVMNDTAKKIAANIRTRNGGEPDA